VRHAHIGAGRFGLGFVGLISKHLGLDLFIFNRADPATGALSELNALIAARRGYEIVYQDGERESIPVAGFGVTDSAVGPGSLVTLLSDPETRLLTVSLKGKHEEVTSHVFHGLLARRHADGRKIAVLACENEVTIDELRRSIFSHGTSEQIQHIERVCEFVPCTVDRICANSPKIKNGAVVIATEKHARLSLGVDAQQGFIGDCVAGLGHNSQLIKFELFFEIAVMKKKWLINGPHLLLAVDAMWRGTSDFQQYAKENRQFVRQLLEEFATGLLHICASRRAYPDDFILALEDELRSEIQQTQQRFENEPDGVGRIAWRFIRPTRDDPEALQIFFRNLGYKLLEPANAYLAREGHAPNCIFSALLNLLDLIARGAFLS
jgi:hypothetical protein